MHIINLNDQLSFAIATEEKRLRLIVFNGDEELVCHKADRTAIKQFILTEKTHLFKGRLQLDKTGNHIRVNVKGKTAGIIGLTEFERLIS